MNHLELLHSEKVVNCGRQTVGKSLLPPIIRFTYTSV